MMQHPSYAFDEEDRILWDLVGDDQTDGFFIDVGANDPLEGCVSRSFYEVGWVGINVEPIAYRLNKFYTAQPKSRNLCCALTDKEGEPMVLYHSHQVDHWDTLSEEIAKKKGMVPAGLVPVTTLRAICERWAGDRAIDWLKIDVENWEDKVIAGGDWERFRPRVLCIESFVPHTPVDAPATAFRTYTDEADGEGVTWLPPQRSYESWEPFILAQGYELVTEFQINRFYRRTD